MRATGLVVVLWAMGCGPTIESYRLTSGRAVNTTPAAFKAYGERMRSVGAGASERCSMLRVAILKVSRADPADGAMSLRDMLVADKGYWCAQAKREREARERRRAKARALERKKKAAAEAKAAAERRAREEQARREAEEQRRQEELERQARAAAEAQRLRLEEEQRQKCAAIKVKGTFEGTLALHADEGLPSTDAARGLSLLSSAAVAVQECDDGDEFERHRCRAARKGAQRELRRRGGYVEMYAELGPFDFKRNRFPAEVPRRGWLVQKDAGVGIMKRAPRRIFVSVADANAGESLRDAVAPVLVLLVRAQKARRMNQPENLIMRRFRQQLQREARQWARAGEPEMAKTIRKAAKRAKHWRVPFTVQGVQLLDRRDGTVLYSRPPAIDAPALQLLECAERETETARKVAFMIAAAARMAAASAESATAPLAESSSLLGGDPQADVFGDKTEFDARLNAAMSGVGDELVTNTNSRSQGSREGFGRIHGMGKIDTGGGHGSRAKPARVSRRKKVTVRRGKPSVDGFCMRGDVEGVVSARQQGIEYCYEKELARNPALHGKVRLNWRIAPDGRVSTVKVETSSMRNKVAVGCMKRQIQRWRFPKPKAGMCKVRLTFNFNSSAGE